jgi:hypothetical protein
MGWGGMIQGETDSGSRVIEDFGGVVHPAEKKAVGWYGDGLMVALARGEHFTNLVKGDATAGVVDHGACEDSDHVVEKRPAGYVDEDDTLVPLGDLDGMEIQAGALGLAGNTAKGPEVVLAGKDISSSAHGFDWYARRNNCDHARGNGGAAVALEEVEAVVAGEGIAASIKGGWSLVD